MKRIKKRFDKEFTVIGDNRWRSKVSPFEVSILSSTDKLVISYSHIYFLILLERYFKEKAKKINEFIAIYSDLFNAAFQQIKCMGPEGHTFVAKIAMQLVKPDVRQNVLKVLGTFPLPVLFGNVISYKFSIYNRWCY